MANKLYVSEFRYPIAGVGTLQSEKLGQPALADQIVTIGASSTQSAAFGTETNAIEIVSDTSCCFVIGADPTADNTVNMLLPANTYRQYTVRPGDKIACITP